MLVCAGVAFVGSNDITIGIVQTFEGKWEEMYSRLVRMCLFFTYSVKQLESIGICTPIASVFCRSSFFRATCLCPYIFLVARYGILRFQIFLSRLRGPLLSISGVTSKAVDETVRNRPLYCSPRV